MKTAKVKVSLASLVTFLNKELIGLKIKDPERRNRLIAELISDALSEEKDHHRKAA